MTAWLEIFGAGEGTLPALPPGRTIVGPARFRAQLPSLEAWRSMKLDDMIGQIMEHRGTPTVLLASGDPLWFGFGATLSRHLDPGEYAVHPGPSSFQLAAAEMRWPLQHVTTLSLHARPVELLHPHVAPGARILALTTDATTAPAVASLLAERGYGESILTVLEALGGPAQRVVSAPAAGFRHAIGDFYVLAIDCVASPSARLFPTIAGLPDDAFRNDGQITKREVRAATLARLAPWPGALLWDVGAGCGSVAIEWMRAARDATAIAIERDPARCALIAENARRLGTPFLQVVAGAAPDGLEGLPAPDAVFVGGDVGNNELFDACWSRLKAGGRLVANAVTADGETALLARQQRLGGELVRIEISSLDSIGPHRAFRPRLPVTQWAVTKP